jgi:hypothetical protein
MADVFQPDAALLPLLPAEPDPFANHVYFAAEQSSKGWAVYHNPKPIPLGDGRTRYGLRIPILLAHECVASPEAVVIRAAAIFNQHWNDGESGRG